MGKAYPALVPADESEVFSHPHNLVLTYGISAGVPGMVAVLALFASLARRFWQLASRGERLAASGRTRRDGDGRRRAGAQHDQ